MKLLMITGDRALVSGKKGAFYNTLEEFSKYFDRIDIICPKVFKDSTPKQEFEPLFGNVFIHPSLWPLWLQWLWIVKKGKQIYKEQKFDLMTVHEFPPFYNGLGAKLLDKFIQVPYILEIHHIVGYPRAANLKEWAYRLLFRMFIKFDSAKAKAIRVVNQNQAPDYLIKAGIPREKIKYIPSIYIDFDVFKPMSLEKEYDLIFVGRLESNKGLNLLLEAASNFKILIIGDGSLRESLKFKVRSLKLENNIIFYGWAKDQKEIAELINRSKLFVMLSYNEGGPRVVFEALACGVPVLATTVGLVPDFKSSITIVDWNAKDIVSKAKKLLNDTNAYEGMKIQGLATVRQFEKKSAIRNYAERIKELV